MKLIEIIKELELKLIIIKKLSNIYKKSLNNLKNNI